MRHLKIIILYITFLSITFTKAQSIVFGNNNYIEYQIGTLPIIISVSHGGNIEPTTIPNRTCNNPVFAVDAFTIETALEIKNRLYTITGCYPHIIISHLKRNKLDPNRNLTDGACGNAEAIIAWNEFHNFITTARNTANQQYNNKTFFIDLHGHGNAIQRIELGYLLYDNELELSDNVLNSTQYINFSSIKNLAINNVNNYSHSQLLKGPFSFGSYLANNNYPSVPSQITPFPGTSSNYFSGGYITANHTCYSPTALINGLQMELNFNNIRDTPSNRTLFSIAFTQAIIEYLNKHLGPNWNTCTPLSTINNSINNNFMIYPNPILRGDPIHLENVKNSSYEYKIFNSIGQLIDYGILNSSKTIATEKLTSGVYFIKIMNNTNIDLLTQKIIIE